MFDHRIKHRAQPRNAPVVIDRHSGRVVGRLNNVSADGMLLVCDKAPESIGLLELVMPLPREICGFTELQFEAEMVRSDPIGQSGLVGCGLRLRHLSEEEAEVIDELIRDCL
jgi:hypothetical protein